MDLKTGLYVRMLYVQKMIKINKHYLDVPVSGVIFNMILACWCSQITTLRMYSVVKKKKHINNIIMEKGALVLNVNWLHSVSVSAKLFQDTDVLAYHVCIT